VNYDPDSAGVAATERSLALLLEEGFEAKVLALPGKLDPDSFIGKEGSGRYRELLTGAPSYLDYLTDRAISAHGIGTPEGRVAVANAITPYLAKVPNAMLRADLANTLATRLRIEDGVVRKELMRAAGALKGQIHPHRQENLIQANYAVKELLRACLGSEEVADAVLPELVASGAAQGLLGEAIFTRLWEARQRGEVLDVTSEGANLPAAERKLALEALFSPVRHVTAVRKAATNCIADLFGPKDREMGAECGCPKCQAKRAGGAGPASAEPDEEPPVDGRVAAASELAMGAIRALRDLQLLRERRDLARELEAAERSGDASRLSSLQRAKEELEKAARGTKPPQKEGKKS
jgi:hypothetical protein